MPQKADDPNFRGFRQPKANYSKLPHQFISLLPEINSLAEMKVLLYLLRHTWGFKEYGTKKRITIDEFVHGRKRSDGNRYDAGTGLSEQGVRDGLAKALAHKFIVMDVDDRDKARVKKFYGLNIARAKDLEAGVQTLDPQTFEVEVKSLDPNPQNFVPRSEKETLERNLKKETNTLPNGNGSTPQQSKSVVSEEITSVVEEKTHDTANVPEDPLTPVPPAPSPRKGAAHYPHYLALLKQWGHDPDKVNKVKAVKDRFMGVAKSLEVFGLSADDIPAFYEYVCKKAKAGKWKSWTVNALPNYAPEFLAQQPKSKLPLVDKELDDMFAQHFSARSANDA